MPSFLKTLWVVPENQSRYFTEMSHTNFRQLKSPITLRHVTIEEQIVGRKCVGEYNKFDRQTYIEENNAKDLIKWNNSRLNNNNSSTQF